MADERISTRDKVKEGDKITPLLADDRHALGAEEVAREGIVAVARGKAPRIRRHWPRSISHSPKLRDLVVTAAMMHDYALLNWVITHFFYIYSNDGRDIHMRFAYNPEGSDDLMMFKEYIRYMFTEGSQRSID